MLDEHSQPQLSLVKRSVSLHATLWDPASRYAAAVIDDVYGVFARGKRQLRLSHRSVRRHYCTDKVSALSPSTALTFAVGTLSKLSYMIRGSTVALELTCRTDSGAP